MLGNMTGGASLSCALHAAPARAGNYGSDSDVVKDTPTNFGLDIMVSVAASDLQDAIPAYSNFGPGRVHLAAPGSEILSTVPSERYYVLSGARGPGTDRPEHKILPPLEPGLSVNLCLRALVGPGSRAKLCAQPLGPGSAAAESLNTSLEPDGGHDAS